MCLAGRSLLGALLLPCVSGHCSPFWWKGPCFLQPLEVAPKTGGEGRLPRFLESLDPSLNPCRSHRYNPGLLSIPVAHAQCKLLRGEPRGPWAVTLGPGCACSHGRSWGDEGPLCETGHVPLTRRPWGFNWCSPLGSPLLFKISILFRVRTWNGECDDRCLATACRGVCAFIPACVFP